MATSSCSRAFLKPTANAKQHQSSRRQQLTVYSAAGERPAAIAARLSSALGAAAAVAVLLAAPVEARLNPYEEAAGGEFGQATAQQFGEADLKGRDFSNMQLQARPPGTHVAASAQP